MSNLDSIIITKWPILKIVAKQVSNLDSIIYQSTELQKREGIIFSYFSAKTCCDPSLEQSQQDSSNDGSQNLFLWRNMAKLFKIIAVTWGWSGGVMVLGKLPVLGHHTY